MITNKEIRIKALESGVLYWQIAAELGITPESFSRSLRQELDSEKKKELFKPLMLLQKGTEVIQHDTIYNLHSKYYRRTAEYGVPQRGNSGQPFCIGAGNAPRSRVRKVHRQRKRRCEFPVCRLHPHGL